MKMKSIALALLVATGLLGCTSSFDISEEAKNAPCDPKRKMLFRLPGVTLSYARSGLKILRKPGRFS